MKIPDAPESLALKKGEFESIAAQVNRGYRRFARRYGWKIWETFNSVGDRPETDIEEYNRERGLD